MAQKPDKIRCICSTDDILYLAFSAEMQIIFLGYCSQYTGNIGITAIAILAMKGTAAKKHRNDR